MTRPGHAECGCSEDHPSVLASLYCAEQMEGEDRAARRTPKVKRPSPFIRSEN